MVKENKWERLIRHNKELKSLLEEVRKENKTLRNKITRVHKQKKRIQNKLRLITDNEEPANCDGCGVTLDDDNSILGIDCELCLSCSDVLKGSIA